MCQKFYLFEPICTAILLAATSGPPIFSSLFHLLLTHPAAIHVIRIHAIYDKDRTILGVMSALFGVQIVVTAVSSGFYRCPSFFPFFFFLVSKQPSPAVPLLSGQGCIAGPRHAWVGIYWIAPTLLYTVSVSFPSSLMLHSLILPSSLWLSCAPLIPSKPAP